MKRIENNWIKAILAGTALILIYKLIDNFTEVRSFIGMLTGIFFPCILGAVIAFLLYIPAKKLQELCGKVKINFVRNNSKVIGTLLLYLIIFLLIGLTITYLVPRLYKNIEELVYNIPKYMDKVENFVKTNKYLQNFSPATIVDDKISEYFNMSQINKYIGIISGIANSFISVFVSIVISIYIILEKDGIMRYMRRARKVVFGGGLSTLTLYIKRVITIFYSYLAGLALDGAVVGIISWIGFSVLRVPYAVLLGFITAIGNMIPFFGPIVATVIIVLISLISGGIWRVVSVLIFISVVYLIDGYLIQPKVIGGSTGLKPLLVLVAVTVFGDLFGFVGMLTAVPMMATIKMIVDDYLEDGKIDGN